MYHQNKGERVCFYPIVSMYIYLYYLYSLCMCVFYYFILFIYKYSEGIGALFGAHFLVKRALCLLTLPKQMPFLTISDKNIFFETQGRRLGAIVAPSKRLE